MKKYKFLVPILLVVVFVLSAYTLYTTKNGEIRKYQKYIDVARSKREQGIQTDAEENYKAALGMKPSLELYLEIGEFYSECRNTGGYIDTDTAIEWGERILKKYPKEKAGYEFLLNIYMEADDYVSCFKLADKMGRKQVVSKSFTEKMQTIEYSFFLADSQYIDVGIYSGGLCPVRVKEKWGYVNASGKKIIPNEYMKAGYFSGELAPVVGADGSAYYIDGTGNKKKVIVNIPDVKELGLLSNGIFPLFNGNTWGFYNGNEELLFGGYTEVSALGNGAAAVKQAEKWMLINAEGNRISDKTYDGAVMDEKRIVCRNGRIFVYNNDCCYMLDSSGNVIGKKFEDARIFNDETYAAVKIDGKWGFIDKNGEVKIKPQFEDARSFSNGFAAVKSNGKWGFINGKGTLVIEFRFDGAKDFTSSGSVFVLQGENWQLLRLYKYNH